MSVVLDASTALSAVLPDERSSSARAIVEAAAERGVIVPSLWACEIQNALVIAVRRGRCSERTASEALEILRSLADEVVEPRGLGTEYRLAITHQLTAYDAVYLSVAIASGAALVTEDRRLRAAASAAGVDLFTP